LESLLKLNRQRFDGKEGSMQNEGFNYTTEPDCNHQKHQVYTQRRVDVLNGFEFTLTRCV